MSERLSTWWQDGHALVGYRWTHKNGGFDLTWIGRAINVYHRWTRWLRPVWWYWIFKDNSGLRNVLCRLRGHPAGEVFYNPNGLEPDHHCRNCDEIIG